MRIVYGVEYIEVEFGDRPWGWRLYTDLHECKSKTRNDEKTGYSPGQYLGPVKPLVCYEIPFD